MCNSRKDAVATDPRRTSRTARGTTTSASASARTAASTSSAALSAAARTHTASSASSSNTKPSAASTSSSAPSLASLRDFLPESPILYPFSEICSATNNFLAKRLSSSSANSWRCTLRGRDAVVFQRRFLRDPASLRRRLASTSKIHHSSIVRLLGASLGGDHIFLVYEYVNGATLADCLRNPRNQGFTTLSTWVDRMQVAADVAQGLEYIHHYAAIGTPTPGRAKADAAQRRGPVHNRLTSSGVMVTDPQLRAKICHFGAAELSGEVPAASDADEGIEGNDKADGASPKLRRTASREVRFEGTRGYIAPEVLDGGAVSQKSDVFAFGVLLLELLTGEEPVKHRYNRETQGYESVSLVGTAREVIGGSGEQEEEIDAVEGAAAERHRKLRRWVDRRLKDSYPVEVAERAVRVALGCVDGEAGNRPDMVRVAGKLSRLLVESRAWADKVRVPTEFSVSMAPR
ncbi:hypothetical protein Taro_034156 [Colocasia esculenta]|uniref:Protein kinase domain-containing protein n=1 Tax=Colocasia esculenta TaxID=4460 RepID=A0A843VVQ1_COLES|nr:hypothetical protein [Colocasia esculenta]